MLSTNLPPTVSLDSPAPGNYLTPIAFNLAATASDPDGAIDHVDFLSNGTTLATKLTPPYTFTWTSVLPGSYQLTADGRCPSCAAAVPGRWGNGFAGQIGQRPFRTRIHAELRILNP